MKKIVQFIALTYLVSFLYAGIYYLWGGRLGGFGGTIFAISYMFIPLLSGFVLQKYVSKRPLSELGTQFSLKGKFKWYLLSWSLPVLINIVVIPISLMIPGVSFSSSMEGMFVRYKDLLTPDQLAEMRRQLALVPSVVFFFVTVFQALIASISVNMLAAFGEEAGWRGFLYKQVEKWNFWKASLFTGVVWGLWHFPFIIQGYNYPQHPVLGVFMMTVFTTGLSPWMHYLRQKTGSIWSAAIFHGGINATVGVGLMYLMGGSDITVGLLGAAGVITLVLANIALWAIRRKESEV